MSFIAAATFVGSAVGLTGTAAVIGGGALIGAGAGGLYSGITGDGDIGQSMLTGAALGAGGAGLASGLTAAGATTAEGLAAQQATQQAAGQVIAEEAAKNAAIEGIALPENYAQLAAQSATPQQVMAQQTIGGNLAQAGRGIGALGTETGRAAFSAGVPSGTVPALGYGAYKALTPKQEVPGTPGPDEYDKRLAKYHIADNYKAYEAPRPNPYYQAQYPSYAAGGLAMGGPAPQTNFADPSQSMMGTSQYDMHTDPMSGNIAQRNMAEGGVTGGGQMQLNVPLSVGGGGGGGGGGLGGGGGYGGYDFTGGPGLGPDINNFSGGGGYTSPGSAGLGSLANILRGGQANPLVGPQQQQQPTAQENPTVAPEFDGTSYSTNSTNSTTSADMGYKGPVQRGLGGKGGFSQQPADNTGKGIGFAKGGYLSSSAGIPDTGLYYDSDLVTRGEQALGASQAKNKQLYKRAGLKYVEGPKSGIEKLGGGFSEAGASGGLSHLGSYSDGGRMLKGPGDGMSDDIPAMIGKKQPARLADGEFVVPADVVSHLGNGSTDAGAKRLYGMMDKIRKARTGKKTQGKQINPNKFMPV